MTDLDETPNLEHFGVKGMRWGRRKDRKMQRSLAKQGGKGSTSADAAQAAALKKKIKKARGKTHVLSNEEMKSLIARMDLEEKYSKHTKGKHSKRLKTAKDVANSFEGLVGSGIKMTEHSDKLLTFAKSDNGKEITRLIGNKGARKAAAVALRAVIK